MTPAVQVILDVGAILAAIAILLNGFWQRRLNRSKATRYDADAGRYAAESVRLLLEPLNTRIASLEAQLVAFASREKVLNDERVEREGRHKAEVDSLKTVQAVMQSEINELRGGVEVLVAQLEGSGIVPRWKPKPKTGPLGKGAKP